MLLIRVFKFSYLFFLVLLCISLKAFADISKVRFFQLDIEDGLSQNDVYSILQDQEGILWFATQDGLNRYDGYQFTWYRYDPKDPKTLPHNYVRHIFEDSEGIIWVATDNGLGRFNRIDETFTRFLHDPNNPASLSNNSVWSILEDNQKNLWIATQSGVNLFDRRTGEFKRFQHDPYDINTISHDKTYSLMKDRQGKIRIGTEVGWDLVEQNEGKITFKRYGRKFDKNGELIQWGPVLSMVEDRNGTLWIGTFSGGLIQFNPKNDRQTRFLHDPNDPGSLSGNLVRTIIEENDRLWIGTNQGLALMNRQTERFTHFKHSHGDHHTIAHNIIRSFHIDRSGLFWIGTGGGGISKVNIPSFDFHHHTVELNRPDGLKEKMIYSFFEDHEGIVWIGTLTGLYRWHRQKNSFKLYQHDPNNPNTLSGNRIRAIHEDQNGTLWVGTDRSGLNRFDRKSETFYRVPVNPNTPKTALRSPRVWQIHSHNRDFLWLGTDWGLTRMDLKRQRFKHFPMSNTWTIEKSASNHLWLGTWGHGVLKFDLQREEFIKKYTTKEGLSDDRTFGLHEDLKGNLWIGTWGGGLNRFDPKKEQFQIFTEQDGLSNDTVYAIHPGRKDELWLSTNQGLSRFNPETLKFENYHVEDGVQSPEFNLKADFRSRSGELFFGGVNGFNLFYPEQISRFLKHSPVVISKIQSLRQNETTLKPVPLDKPLSKMDAVQLSWKESLIAFEFAVLDYANPKKNRFTYKLEGYDQSWIDAGTRNMAMYTKLPGGVYTFRVRGANHQGIWNNLGASIKVVIVPLWWETDWARLLFIILAIGTGGTAIYFHAKHQNRKWKDLKSQSMNEFQVGDGQDLNPNSNSNEREKVGDRQDLNYERENVGDRQNLSSNFNSNECGEDDKNRGNGEQQSLSLNSQFGSNNSGNNQENKNRQNPNSGLDSITEESRKRNIENEQHTSLKQRENDPEDRQNLNGEIHSPGRVNPAPEQLWEKRCWKLLHDFLNQAEKVPDRKTLSKILFDHLQTAIASDISCFYFENRLKFSDTKNLPENLTRFALSNSSKELSVVNSRKNSMLQITADGAKILFYREGEHFPFTDREQELLSCFLRQLKTFRNKFRDKLLLEHPQYYQHIGHIRTNLKKVLFVTKEPQGQNILVKMTSHDTPYKFRMPLNQFGEFFNTGELLKVQRSYWVNPTHVQTITIENRTPIIRFHQDNIHETITVTDPETFRENYPEWFELK